jgi:hypothetical protein
MGHQRACRAAVDGKHPASKTSRTRQLLRRAAAPYLIAAALFGAAAAALPAYAQSGPFAGMAGRWSGGGTITLDDGSSERIRCRATYVVRGAGMNMSLTCASDAYKFDLAADVVDQGGAISGNWSESSRNVTGTLQGRGGGGNFQVVANAAGFNANISLHTAGNKQTVTMRADNQFRGANISLSR